MLHYNFLSFLALTLSSPIDGVASIGMLVFSFLMERLDHAMSSSIFWELPPYTEREKKPSEFLHTFCFCQKQELKMGRLRSKRVQYPLLHFLSACFLKKCFFLTDFIERSPFQIELEFGVDGGGDVADLGGWEDQDPDVGRAPHGVDHIWLVCKHDNQYLHFYNTLKRHLTSLTGKSLAADPTSDHIFYSPYSPTD